MLAETSFDSTRAAVPGEPPAPKVLEVGGVPLLLRSPLECVAVWKRQLRHWLDSASSGIDELETLAKGLPAGKIKARLTTERGARIAFKKQIEGLFSPLGRVPSNDSLPRFQFTVPFTAPLLSYIDNVFRDWAWGEAETETNLELCKESLESAGPLAAERALVLGAGAGRLAVELHRSLGNRATLATDLSPFLLFVAVRMLREGSLELNEFPAAPRDTESRHLEQILRGPGPVAGFELAFVDARRPALKDASFDLLVAPWLLDVLPGALVPSLARMARLLEIGGRFLFFGPFQRRLGPANDVQTLEELREVLGLLGLRVLAGVERELPYLDSPYSAGRRSERLTAFCAIKEREGPEIPADEPWPQWILDPGRPIEAAPQWIAARADNELHARILSRVDGKTNLGQIAASLAREFGLKEPEAQLKLRAFFARLIENGTLS